MMSGFISRIVILLFGTLYPAYASYKAVRTKNVKEYVKWMMYWIVFALFTCIETFTDLFLSFWFPFYYEIKIITVIYLLSPATNGSSILYRKFVHPVLIKREQEIDEYIAKAKEQGYHTVLNLGTRGVTLATSLIMQTAIKGLPNLPIIPSTDFLPNKTSGESLTLEDDLALTDDLKRGISVLQSDIKSASAEDVPGNNSDSEFHIRSESSEDVNSEILFLKQTDSRASKRAKEEGRNKVKQPRRRSKSRKGGGGIFNQLKKSYSLNDLSEDQCSQNPKQDFNDQVDNRYMEGAGAVHRIQSYSPRHTISGASCPESYFSEVDAYQGPLDLDEKNYYRYSREMPISGISSGYSSEDSLPFGNVFKEPGLVRSGSLGTTNRIRTRASSKNALPKRASLAEGGSTWSMEEPRESQLGSQEPYHIPWTRSLSVPFSVTPLNHLIKPEYQHLFRQITQEQMLAFLSQTQFDPISGSQNEFCEAKEDGNKNVDVTSNSVEIISDAKNETEKNCSVSTDKIVDDKKSTTDGLNVEEVSDKPGTGKELEIKNDKEESASEGKSTLLERSGKYNKRPAPVPPSEDSHFKNCSFSPFEQDKKEDTARVEREAEEDDAAVFVTPNSSPTSEKKLNFSTGLAERVITADNGTSNDSDKPKLENLEVPKKAKVRGKNISKKLHLPKMSFSFWGQKSTKNLSGSENSSIASSDNIVPEGESSSINNNNKNNLEFFIPLRDENANEAGNGKE